MQESLTSYHTFPSGLRLVHRQMPSPVSYLGIMVGAGTRDELPSEIGMAHYVEHTVFKGTTHRTSRAIINRIENVGGEINAYTTKEETTFYVAAPVEYSARALELLADMLFHPSFPREETDKERHVIYDEIESYNDSPSELIYDDFESLLFAGHPLANPILGTKKTLRYFNADRAHAFMQRTYLPARMVVFCESSLPFSRFLRLAEHYVEPEAMARLLSSSPKMAAAEVEGSPAEVSARLLFVPAVQPDREALFRKHTHQSHVMLGGHAYPIGHPRQLTAYLLNNILGGGSMNSLLNLSLREKKGLVYTVESIYTPLSDTGYWSVYFACDPENREQCLQLVDAELARLAAQPLSEATLRRALRQLRGQLAIAAENRENSVLSMAKLMLYRGEAPQWTATYQQIASLTTADLHAVAEELFCPEARFLLQYC